MIVPDKKPAKPAGIPSVGFWTAAITPPTAVLVCWLIFVVAAAKTSLHRSYRRRRIDQPTSSRHLAGWVAYRSPYLAKWLTPQPIEAVKDEKEFKISTN